MTNPNGTGNPGAGQGSTLDNRLDQIKQKAKGLVDQGSEKVDHLKTRVIDAKDQAVSKGNMYLDRTSELIKANPIKAVGIAFGLGYIGMRLFRR